MLSLEGETMPKALAPDMRDRIITLLHEGHGCNAIARQVGCSPGSITKIAAAEGVTFERSQTRNATAARVDYDQAERLALLNELFGMARTMAPAVATPAHLQTLATAVAILIDKRRLEDGEATSRTDVVTNDARDRIARRIDELAARRDAQRAAG